MHSDHIAEWILSLVTSRDRAASIAGDLTEGAAARGAVWFWTGVLRTAASLLWRGLAERPARVAGVAAASLAISVALWLLVAGLSVVALVAAHIKSGHPVEVVSIGYSIWFFVPALLIPLLTGRLLARWAPGREMSACLAYAIICSICCFISIALFPPGNRFSVSVHVSLIDAAPLALVVAGAVWGRHRRLRALQV
jgi:hypothetical protein